MSQDPAFLILTIHVPRSRTSEFDLYVDGDYFKFYAKPYFLRVFSLHFPKETAGEHFEGLQMLISLLAPNGSGGRPGGVQWENEPDWQVEQQVYMETSEKQLTELQKYVFGNQRSRVFTRLQEKIQGQLKFCSWWSGLSPDSTHQGEAVSFTDDEKEQLRKFTNRSDFLDKKACVQVWLSLVDIIRILLRSAHYRGRVQREACVLMCLLDIHKVFQENEPAFLLNDLFITVYCVWIQRVKKVTALADPLQKVSLRKSDLELELEVLETAALVEGEEEEEKSSSITPQSHSGDESDRTEGHDCADRTEGGRGGESAEASPLQLQPASPLVPQESCAALISAERKPQRPPLCCGQPQPADPGAGREGGGGAVDLCTAWGQQAFQEQNIGRGRERLFTACDSHCRCCYCHSYCRCPRRDIPRAVSSRKPSADCQARYG